jgi:hypothetical protein
MLGLLENEAEAVLPGPWKKCKNSFTGWESRGSKRSIGSMLRFKEVTQYGYTELSWPVS